MTHPIGSHAGHGNVATCAYHIEEEYLEFYEFVVTPCYRNVRVFTNVFAEIVKAVHNPAVADSRVLTENLGNFLELSKQRGDFDGTRAEKVRFKYSAVVSEQSIAGLVEEGWISREYRTLEHPSHYHRLGPKLTGKPIREFINYGKERELLMHLYEAARLMRDGEMDWENAIEKIGITCHELIDVMGISGMSVYSALLDKNGKYLTCEETGYKKFIEIDRAGQLRASSEPPVFPNQ